MLHISDEDRSSKAEPPQHNRSPATLARAKRIIDYRLRKQMKASRAELKEIEIPKSSRWNTKEQVRAIIAKHPYLRFLAVPELTSGIAIKDGYGHSSVCSEDAVGTNDEIRALISTGILTDGADGFIGDFRAAKFEHFHSFTDKISFGLEENREANAKTHEALALLFKSLRRDLKADRLADRKWHRTIPVVNERPTPAMGLRRQGMKQPLLPMSKETFRLKFSNLLRDKADTKEPQLAIPTPSLAKSAKMFKATYVSLTDKWLKPKNGNFQKLVGTRKRNIFGKDYFTNKDGERQSVDWRDGLIRLAWENLRPLVLATPNLGYQSKLADMADPDWSLRKTISSGVSGLDLGLDKFHMRYVEDKETKKGKFVYPLWADLESKAALRCLIILTERMSRIKITTASGVRYKVPPSFIGRLLILINWHNNHYPWYRIHKHDNSRKKLIALWVGEYLSDIMCQLYPDIDQETVGHWIDLVLGAQNDLR